LDSLRYLIAFLLLLGLPPGLFFWIFIHPFAALWRRLGIGWTYGLVGAAMLVLMAGIYLVRAPLLATQFGTNFVCLGLALVCLTGAALIAFQRQKYLTVRIMIGLPELRTEGQASVLLTEGIYARIRHPRYVEVFLAVLGFAFFSNYLVLYVWAVLSLPVLYATIVLEEQELRDRFGHAYVEYCRNVPRFIPRFHS
jgi:protein-S-isoprenylcysteine O-methyltransferase Ste14